MKKLFILASIMLLSFASQAELVTINDSLLTENQKVALKVENTVGLYGKYAGLGKEMGTAFTSFLSSLTKEAVSFSNTKLGGWAMILITWKVVGVDMLRVFVGIPVFLLVIVLLIWQFKVGYYPIKTQKTGGIWQRLKGTAEYEITQPNSNDKDRAFWVLVIGIGIDMIFLSIVLFSGQ